MSQESIYTYRPKNTTNVKSSSDYITTKFPDTASERIERFSLSKQLLSSVYHEYRTESSQNIKQNLQEWLASPSDYVHTSIIMHSRDDILDFENQDWLIASTYARECPNLKTLLRNVTNRFTNRVTDSDRRLVYDFDVLANHLKTRPETTLYIIHLEDTDVFDPQVINDLIGYIAAYPELPLRLVMTLNVPPRAFEERLTRENLEKIEPRLFEQASSAQFLHQAVTALSDAGIYFGERLQAAIDSVSHDTIYKVLNYFLLVYFSTNPLATLNNENIPDYIPLIRRLASFRRIATQNLIESDSALIAQIESTLSCLNAKYSGVLEEILINDVDLYHTVFNPNYRHALETALAEPKYYYPFADPKNIRDRIPVCTLYSSVRSSPMYLNIYDHYCLFRDTMIRPQNVTDEEWQRIAAAWYQQAVTELKSMGILRSTKRKANSLEKVAYKGV